MRPKDIGTRFESSVVTYLRLNGFPHAERRALAGIHDLGDITGTPGIAWECKGGAAAQAASDGQVTHWLDETARERRAAKADIGVLILDRAGYGPKRVSEAWAIIRPDELPPSIAGTGAGVFGARPVRMHLASATRMLRALGYGEPLTSGEFA